MSTSASMDGVVDTSAIKGYDLLLKLLLIGDSSVGKSCLLTRFTDDRFNESFISTIGIDFKVKTVLVRKLRVKLQIWDTAGQERYKTITSAYYRGANGILLVYDVSNEDSFLHINDWINDAERFATNEVVMALVGNKIDRKEDRAVLTEDGERLAKEVGIPFIETSAKDGTQVVHAFMAIASLMVAKTPDGMVGPLADSKESKGVNLQKGGSARAKKCC